MECTTVLLIFNEKENIAPLTNDIIDVYKKNKIEGEILLIDDGSTDGSSRVCDDLAERYGMVRAFHHPSNLGRSRAIRTGFDNSAGKYTIIMDGDRQYEPREIPRFIARMKEGWDVVSGNRTKRADPPIRRVISSVYNRLIIRWGFGLRVQDQNSGFKGFITKKARMMDFDPEGFSGLHRFILPLARIKKLSITEIPIKHYRRVSGRSYISSFTVPFITLRDLRLFRKRYTQQKGD